MGNCLKCTGTASSGSGSGGGVVGGGAVEPTGGGVVREFSLMELQSATENFRRDRILGEGGFGIVYKGFVATTTRSSSRVAVAVKRLNDSSTQGLNEWMTEVNYLSELEHPNLVRLLGHCREEAELLLVYEYVAKGSLENHLFRRMEMTTALSWQTRLSIAIGAARGLAFFHCRRVIYRDLKTANVLLDEGFNPKLSDLGFARSGPAEGNSHVTTAIKGTRGYAAPEYMESGHLYVSSDVYSFGVVLLELVTGLRTLDLGRPLEQTELVPWARQYAASEGGIRRIVDRNLAGQYHLQEVLGVARMAYHCLRHNHNERPTMEQVLAGLEKINATGR